MGPPGSDMCLLNTYMLDPSLELFFLLIDFLKLDPSIIENIRFYGDTILLTVQVSDPCLYQLDTASELGVARTDYAAMDHTKVGL